ncbi:MAG: hypothetical protein ABJA82_09960 [Myxococcales bacterium]
MRSDAVLAMPDIDPATVSFFPDEGRPELRGHHLEGMRVRWQTSAGSPSLSSAVGAKDRCEAPQPVGSAEQCTFALPRSLPADTPLVWLPSTADTVPSAGETQTPLRATRVVLDKLLSTSPSVDLTSGLGRIALVHPEAVAVVDCAQARCELVESGIQVLAVSGAAGTLSLRLRLAPQVFLRCGDVLDASIAATIGPWPSSWRCSPSSLCGHCAPFRGSADA